MPSNPPSQRPRKTWSFKSEVKGPSKTWSFTNDLVLLNLWTCRERMPRHRGSFRKNAYTRLETRRHTVFEAPSLR